jgi:hypothetical protein
MKRYHIIGDDRVVRLRNTVATWLLARRCAVGRSQLSCRNIERAAYHVR